MRAFKHTLTGLFKNILHWYYGATIDLLKIKAVMMYINVIRTTRLVLIGSIALKLCLLLMIAGFMMAHIAVFLLLPYSTQAKAIGLLILSGIYFIIPLIVICIISSERLWMKYSKASEMVRKVVCES